ncbi:MAG: cupin domain-containing protein [Pacificimonas sp.]|jgi:uncharacterized cupin superfamily protein|nr:cupin domain-containing protein [Pacificimonas sp.]
MLRALLLSALAGMAVAANAHEPRVVAPGEGRTVEVPFHGTRLLLSDQMSEGSVSIYEFDLGPGTAGAPPHKHTHEDEYAYVLGGEISFMIGDNVVVAGPGTLAALTRGTPHGFWNAGEMPARALFIVSEGRFERFFDAVAMGFREERPVSPDAANAMVGRIAAAHGITMRPDLIPPEAARYFAPPAD